MTTLRARASAAAAALRDTGPGRLLLAAKTALACVLAWYLAPWVPFAEDQYSYYAPLGALVTMHATLVHSLRTAVQTLVGVAAGIGLGLAALGIMAVGGPGIVALGVVVGTGVLVGAARPFGAGGEWVSMAGLFTLLLGGRDAQDFSVSYLVTLAFGAVVGIVVNLLLIPPLHLARGGRRLGDLRDTASERLDDIAAAVEQGDGDGVEGLMRALDATASAAIADAQDAEDSARANPRALRHREQRRTTARRRRALERTVFSIRDLADALFDADERSSIAPEHRTEVADAVRACAALVRLPIGDDSAPAALRDADAAIERCRARLLPTADGGRAGAALFCLQRIVEASRPFV
ncbi:FUSC family protein [Microbacterium gilvum]|uniref:Aromatic acid exporter family protein n=1 Tax=Microbacterium gilvum TaxID=1336204 RepID=A0ABP8ZVU8_9MICO